MIIDCHAHFDPAVLDADSVIQKMDAAGVHRIAFIPSMNDPLPDVPWWLLPLQRQILQIPGGRRIGEAIHRSTMTADGNLKLKGKVIPIYPRPDNQAVADLVSQHPDRFMSWIFLNPKDNPTVLDELEKWRHTPGMIGVKLHPHWHDYRTEILGPLLTRAEELRLPVLIHLGFRQCGNIHAMLEDHPNLSIIAAHAGIPLYQDLWRLKDRSPNLYVDLSSPYLDERIARKAVATMGAERCLYGTDSPYGFHESDHTYDYGEIKGWIERMPVSSTQQEAIFGGTFSRLLAESGVEL